MDVYHVSTVYLCLPHANRYSSAGLSSPGELAEAWVLLGYGRDLSGAREAALDAYRQAIKIHEAEAEPIRAVNPLVLLSAHRHLKEPFRPGEVEALTVSFPLLSGWE